MKKILFFFAVSLLYAEDRLDFSNPIFISKEKIPNIFDSNILQKPKLQMIINRKAKINGKWYQAGQKISKYDILKITNNSITLKNAHQTLVLYTQKGAK